MATDDLHTLREKLPRLFDDKRVKGEVLEDSIVIGADLFGADAFANEFADADPRAELERLFDEMIEPHKGSLREAGPPPVPDAPGKASRGRSDGLSRLSRSDFPGNYRSHDPEVPDPPPDALGFYVPFHYSRDLWGIYVVAEEYISFCRFIYEQARRTVPEITPALVRRGIDGFIYAHEHYHHKVECFATRLELVTRRPLYRIGFQKLYKQRNSHADSIEEGLATAEGLREARDRLAEHPRAQAEVFTLLKQWVGRLSSEYSIGLDLVDPAQFESRQKSFTEANHNTCFPQLARVLGVMPEVWGAFTFAYRGFIQINSPFSFIIPRGSKLWHRVPHHFRALTARDVRKRISVLGGCVLHRQGGRHEVWACTKTGNQVEIPRHPGDLAKGTLASIARRSCDMSLSEFLNASV